MLSPSLGVVSAGAQLREQSQTLSGLGSIFDQMRPGLSVTFSFGTQGQDGTLALSGRTLTYGTGAGAVSLVCGVTLPNMTLRAGTAYVAAVVNGSLEVVAVV